MNFVCSFTIFVVLVKFTSAQRATFALPVSTMRAKKETTTTAEVTTSPPVTTPGGCIHNWRRYDRANDPNAPLNDGVSMGNYLDGSPEIVARCQLDSGGPVKPAYINLKGRRKSASYSLKWFTEIACLDSTTEYLVDNADYVYKWVSARPDEKYENEVLVADVWGFKLARLATRVNFVNSNGDEYSVLGLRYTNDTTFYYDPADMYGGVTAKAPVEILTCSTKQLAERDYKIPAPRGNGLCAHEWRRFNGENLDEVVENGVLVGYYFDQAPIYVARSEDMNFGYGFGRLTVNGSLSPGVYTADDESEHRDTRISAEYLVRNPAYTYAWVINYSGEPIANSLHLISDEAYIDVVFTRYLWEFEGHDPFTLVPWTSRGIGSSFYDPTDGGEYNIDKEQIEVLVCNTDGSYSAMQESHDGECVHRWKYFDTKKAAPIAEGVEAGEYLNELPMFVGKGKGNGFELLPGRAMVNGTAGVYMYDSENRELFDDGTTAEYLFRNESQVYEWEMSSLSEQKKNIEDTYRGYGEFVAISRVLLTDPSSGDEFHVIGVTHMGNRTDYYNPITKESVQTKDDVELLVCRAKEV